MRYWPNPAHKEETTEAGPPGWNPDKEKCPRDMTVAERTVLLEASIQVEPGNPRSRRFALRRTQGGLEIFDIKHTRDAEGGDPEFHGHPASRVEPSVLKQWRDRGTITNAEYNRLRRELPGC